MISMIKSLFSWLLRFLFTPSSKIGLGVLLIIGFVGGIWFWWGFNKTLELTNSEEFCISCHTMRDNVYQELQETVHWKNRSGVRAKCADCHVPHDFSDKIARKMQASREVLSQIMGDIDTREKFEAHRLVLAQREWKRFKANNSKECKNCHDYASMDFSKMKVTSQTIMQHAAATNGSCVDCHKGIAHKLPDVHSASNPELTALLSTAEGLSLSMGKTYYSVNSQDLFADEALTEKIGSIEISTAVSVVAQKGKSNEVLIDLWRKNKGYGRVGYGHFGLNITQAIFNKEAAQDKRVVEVLETKTDPITGLEWQKIRVKGFIKAGTLTDDLTPVWQVARNNYSQSCSVCHRQPAPEHHDANQWPGLFAGMVGFTSMDDDTAKLVLKYLQTHSSDFVTSGAH